MRFSLAAAALSVAGVYAADHVVTVGENNLLAFNPTSVTAAEGDNIIFQFRSKNHSVTQSTFASPCVASGIDSGFQMTPANATEFATWSFTVNNASAPLWFFCAQTIPAVHCNAGMVFAVNPTQQKSFEAFQAIAKGDNGTAAASGASGAGANATDSSSAGAPGSTDSPAGSTDSTPAVSGGDASGTDSSAANSSPTAGTQGAAAGSNGAIRMGASIVSLITLAGLVAGLAL